jgi:hypothetical protein
MNLQILFDVVSLKLDDPNLPENELYDVLDILKKICTHDDRVVKGVQYWENTLNELKKINKIGDINQRKQDIKSLVNKYIRVDNEHTLTLVIIVQKLSHGVIHRIWDSIYNCYPKYHTDPKNAIMDAMYSKVERSQQLFRELMLS